MISRGYRSGFCPPLYWREFLHIDSPAFTPPITSLGISFFSTYNQSQKVGRVQSFFYFNVCVYYSTPHSTIHTSTLMYLHQSFESGLYHAHCNECPLVQCTYAYTYTIHLGVFLLLCWFNSKDLSEQLFKRYKTHAPYIQYYTKYTFRYCIMFMYNWTSSITKNIGFLHSYFPIW